MPTTLIERETIQIISAAQESELISLANGNFAILWATDDDAGAAATPGIDILMQLYNPLGDPIGQPVLVAPSADNDYGQNQNFSAVARGNDIILAYESASEFGTVIRATEVRSDVGGGVDVLGTVIVAGANFILPISNPVVSFSPGAGLDDNGTFLVAYTQATGGGDTRLIQHEVEAGGAGPVSAAQVLLSTSVGADADLDAQTAAATLTNGNVVFVANSASTIGDSIGFRITDPEGEVVSVAQVVPGTGNNGLAEEQADVSALADGGFVVVWRSVADSGMSEILFQKLTANGTPDGAMGTVENPPIYFDVSQPTSVALSDGGFVVVWIEQMADLPNHIYGQRFDANGDPIGQAVDLHLTSATLSDPELSVLPDGRLIVAWTSESVGVTKSEYKIYDTLLNIVSGQPGADDVLVALEQASHVHGDGAFHDAGDGANDTLYATGVGDTLYGGYGDDTLISGRDADVMFGGAGFDVASYVQSNEGVEVSLPEIGDATGDAKGFGGYAYYDKLYKIEGLIGSQHDDTLVGRFSGKSYLDGQGGSDLLVGLGGGNTLLGRQGDDELFDAEIATQTDTQTDVFKGGEGHDSIRLSSGENAGFGGKGNDVFTIHTTNEDPNSGARIAFDSDNVIRGGAGRDRVQFGHDGPQGGVKVNLAEGTVLRATGQDDIQSIEDVRGTAVGDVIKGDANDNRLDGGGGADVLRGGAGRDLLWGQSGQDDISGGKGSDAISGGTGRDLLIGNGGNDRIVGGKGGDKIIGGSGNDVMIGGEGGDHFVFRSASAATAEDPDKIIDFGRGKDRIGLTKLATEDIEISLLGDFATNGPSLRTSETSDGNTIIRIDLDGDRNTDMKIVLSDYTGMSESDFLI